MHGHDGRSHSRWDDSKDGMDSFHAANQPLPCRDGSAHHPAADCDAAASLCNGYGHWRCIQDFSHFQSGGLIFAFEVRKKAFGVPRFLFSLVRRF